MAGNYFKKSHAHVDKKKEERKQGYYRCGDPDCEYPFCGCGLGKSGLRYVKTKKKK